VRGDVHAVLGQRITWHVGGFGAVNSHDILFQTTGGTTANRGFFANVGDTARRGVEVGVRGTADRLAWGLSYSFLRATFEDRFEIFSPHHPDARNGRLTVEPGDRLPGIPEHSLKLDADYLLASRLRVGGNLLVNSDQYFRGDEVNRLHPLGAYAIVGLRGEYRFNAHVSVFVRIDNLFDTDYETFGLLGEPSGPPGTRGLRDPRFVSPGAPRAGWLGIRLEL
jgi:outer membrane receptor protein involved in Fe transport